MERRFIYRTNIQEITVINKDLDSLKKEWNIPETELRQLILVLEELLSSIIENAYPDNSEEKMDLVFKLEPGNILLTLSYDGKPFNPIEVNESGHNDLTYFDSGRLGISLMKSFVDSLSYSRDENTNSVTILKRIKNPTGYSKTE